MKFFFVAPMMLATAFLQGGGGRGGGRGTPAMGSTSEATSISPDKVAGCAKASTLFTGPEYSVICYNRSTAGGSEAHATHAHIWYIVEGEATVITGGTIVDMKMDSPGEPRGSGIQGGQTHHLAKGSVIVIPAGVPHQYKEVMKPVAYYSVNVEKPKR